MALTYISIIVPVYNEQILIKENFRNLKGLDEIPNVELIFVDGGSDDGSISFISSHFKNVLRARKGRASQMNAGAAQAKGDVLIFLHIDTLLPTDFDASLSTFQQSNWGFFKLRLSGDHWAFRIIEWAINLRSKLFNYATGDQCLVVSRELFKRLEGFRELALMEDLELTRRLKKITKPVILRQIVTSSSRRWESKGILQTILLMWFLQLGFYIGVNPKKLAQWYR